MRPQLIRPGGVRVDSLRIGTTFRARGDGCLHRLDRWLKDERHCALTTNLDTGASGMFAGCATAYPEEVTNG